MKRILIVGCGDIALRVAALLKNRYRLFGLIRTLTRSRELRAAGITPLPGDLDHPDRLSHLAGLAHIVLHFAPPRMQPRLNHDGISVDCTDLRTRHLLAALSRGTLPQRLIYISTSGVYGDCAGASVSETRPLNAQTVRAQRRVDAENLIRNWAGGRRVNAGILRVPGIYAADRLPLERIRAGTPAITAEEDSYTNHIHADDLARIVVAAMRRAKPNRVYHASDDSELKMGSYFDAVADAFNLPRPPRVSRAQAQQTLSPAMLSFVNESRRLRNTRLKQELRVTLRYPTVADLLAEITLRC
jgi:nucleoside-diphosphate-sugar epimerase